MACKAINAGCNSQPLTPLINFHNSNISLLQTTLLGEIIPEEKFFLLGFVLGRDIK